jgi:hypothetical protein
MNTNQSYAHDIMGNTTSQPTNSSEQLTQQAKAALSEGNYNLAVDYLVMHWNKYQNTLRI